jgi:glycosyltransferase involved in cell wall biosynthesis
MARILSVVWYKILPAQFGGQKGIAEFNEHLAEHHTLYCLCSKNNEYKKVNYTVLAELPVHKIQVINPANWWKINQKIRELNISHLILEHCYYGLAGIWARKFLSVKLIVHAHNIEATRFREIGKWWWRFLWLLEKKTYQASDLVLFKTPEDRDFAIRHFSLTEEQCMIVPYGLTRKNIPQASEKMMAGNLIRNRHNIGFDEKILLFTGTLDYAPNANALLILVDIIIPMLNKLTEQPFRLVVCGRIINPEYQKLLSLNHEHYIYAGLVEDLDNYLLAADVFLNPVAEGGGIKVKTMEALAFNLPVISTEHSARGIDRTLVGKKLSICRDNDWHTFCQLITEAWHMNADTPDEFFKAYHWTRVIEPFLEKIKTL